MRRVHPVATAIAALGALFVMNVEATAQQAGGERTGALPPETSTLAEPTDPTSSGMILVSKRPIEVLASPSSSASILYGFPPGRPVRLIGRDGSFAKIQDVKSGAIGWIDETAVEVAPSVAAAPTSEPPVGSMPSEPKTAPLNQTAERRGIFGGQGGLSGFLGGVFGTR